MHDCEQLRRHTYLPVLDEFSVTETQAVKSGTT